MTPSVLLVLVLIAASQAAYIPSQIPCGQASDITDVPSFPFSLYAANGDYSTVEAKWENPIPRLTTRLMVNGVEESTFLNVVDALSEVNDTGSVYGTFASYNLTTAVWNTSTAKTSACEALYMTTSLPNGGIIEFAYYFYKTNQNFSYAGSNYTANRGDLNFAYLLRNYTFREPGVSKPLFQFFIEFPVYLKVNRTIWESNLGESGGFPADPVEVNVTTFGIPNDPFAAVPKYEISKIYVIQKYMNYALLAGEVKENVFFRAVARQVGGQGIKNFILYETLLGNYNSSSIVSHLQRNMMTSTVTKNNDGSSASSSESGAASNISSFVPALLSLFN